MTDGAGGVVERFFHSLNTCDWDTVGALVATGVERIGPQGERQVGRDEYIELMARTESDGGQQSTWDVHSIAYTMDARSAFARVTAHVPQFDLRFEETLTFAIDADELISLIEVFWRDPFHGRGA